MVYYFLLVRKSWNLHRFAIQMGLITHWLFIVMSQGNFKTILTYLDTSFMYFVDYVLRAESLKLVLNLWACRCYWKHIYTRCEGGIFCSNQPQSVKNKVRPRSPLSFQTPVLIGLPGLKYCQSEVLYIWKDTKIKSNHTLICHNTSEVRPNVLYWISSNIKLCFFALVSSN